VRHITSCFVLPVGLLVVLQWGHQLLLALQRSTNSLYDSITSGTHPSSNPFVAGLLLRIAPAVPRHASLLLLINI
jgi:hypothetical protein